MFNNITYLKKAEPQPFDFENGFIFEVINDDESYDAVVYSHKLMNSFNTMKLVFAFKAKLGEAVIYLPRYFNLTTADRKGFTAGPKSDLFRDCVRLFNISKKDFDELSIDEIAGMFYGNLFSITVRTVTTDHRKRPLASALSYPVVNEVRLIYNQDEKHALLSFP